MNCFYNILKISLELVSAIVNFHWYLYQSSPVFTCVYVYLFMGMCPHQHVSSSEQVAEGVVEQVDEWGSIQVSVTHHLRRKQSLPRAAAEQTSHHPVAHVHVMSHFLMTQRKSLNQHVSVKMLVLFLFLVDTNNPVTFNTQYNTTLVAYQCYLWTTYVVGCWLPWN